MDISPLLTFQILVVIVKPPISLRWEQCNKIEKASHSPSQGLKFQRPLKGLLSYGCYRNLNKEREIMFEG